MVEVLILGEIICTIIISDFSTIEMRKMVSKVPSPDKSGNPFTFS